MRLRRLLAIGTYHGLVRLCHRLRPVSVASSPSRTRLTGRVHFRDYPRSRRYGQCAGVVAGSRPPMSMRRRRAFIAFRPMICNWSASRNFPQNVDRELACHRGRQAVSGWIARASTRHFVMNVTSILPIPGAH